MIIIQYLRLRALTLVFGPVLLLATDGRTLSGEPQRPPIRKLGTLDLDMVETTPVVFRDRLYRFEYVRPGYQANKTGDSYFRFIDVETGKATPAFAQTFDLGCALRRWRIHVGLRRGQLGRREHLRVPIE